MRAAAPTKRIIGDDMARFRSKMERVGDCDIWRGNFTTNTGSTRKTPMFYAGHRMWAAAQWWREQTSGPLPAGTVMLRTCGQPLCVRLADGHCTPVSRATVIRHHGNGPAAAHAAKDRCVHGHPFSPENTRLDGKGARVCLQCRRDYPSASKRYGQRAGRG